MVEFQPSERLKVKRACLLGLYYSVSRQQMHADVVLEQIYPSLVLFNLKNQTKQTKVARTSARIWDILLEGVQLWR